MRSTTLLLALAVAASSGQATADAQTGPRRLTAAALGDATSHLLFMPLPPCRLVDTRLAGGALVPGTTRSFQVAGATEFGPQGGTLGGCGVPVGSAAPAAPAVALNLVA